MRITIQVSRPSFRRLPVALALGLLMLAGPAFASHQFTDVSDANTFHTSIARIADAGLAAGCTTTTYCPTEDVTRGQMAAFLGRSGGRIAYDSSDSIVQISTAAATPSILATLTIQPGGIAGGTAFVQIMASAHAQFPSATGLPATAHFRIREQGGAYLSGQGWSTLASAGIQSAGFLAVVTVPTGVAKTYELTAYRQEGTAGLISFGWMSATSYPFSGDGDDVLDASGASSVDAAVTAP